MEKGKDPTKRMNPEAEFGTENQKKPADRNPADPREPHPTDETPTTLVIGIRTEGDYKPKGKKFYIPPEIVDVYAKGFPKTKKLYTGRDPE